MNRIKLYDRHGDLVTVMIVTQGKNQILGLAPRMKPTKREVMRLAVRRGLHQRRKA